MAAGPGGTALAFGCRDACPRTRRPGRCESRTGRPAPNMERTHGSFTSAEASRVAPPVRHRSGGPLESAHPRNEPIAAGFDPFFDGEPVHDSDRGAGSEDRPRSAIGHSQGTTGGKDGTG
ncbi:hypothetical protein Shyhy01_33250 [Streptomyces hygroscopicus subsp. hygroscopicus]|nr:hypothetical protein Shyhy01_33250 [Streptomyces hygroscopicus subsp. hygroscopicus]